MEKHITIGVAGHVDHGKTSLVRSLTGIDTDRLKEEKRRGLSIEAGIAPLELPSGARVALVDVPGHSDYLKNTIRGLSNADMAILVVAADDGVMPQTRDHLEIIHLMKAKTGFVVLSKADLVDNETLDLAAIEVREIIEGTVLESCPVIPFSALDRRGAGEILVVMEDLCRKVNGKKTDAPFRLWIDQVRSSTGFGTVAAGTILTGKVSVDDPLQLLPSGKETKARFLEVHHHRVDQAIAGQRVGINLHRVPMDDLRPGMVLASPAALRPSYLLNAELFLLPKARKPVRDRQRIRLYVGTCVTNALLVLMEKQRIGSGETGLVQLRTLEPLAVLPKDPFLISFMNVHGIVGGGAILEPTDEKYRAVKTSKIVPYLRCLHRGDVKSATSIFFQRFASRPLTTDELALGTGFSAVEIEAEITSKSRAGELIRLGDCGWFLRARYELLKKQLADVARTILSRDAFKVAATAEELRYRLEPSLDQAPFERMLADLCREAKVVKTEAGYRVPNLLVRLPSAREKVAVQLLEYARGLGCMTFAAGTFCKLHGKTFDLKEIQKLLDYLHKQKKLVRLNDGRFVTWEAMERIKQEVRRKILREGSLTLAGSKELLGYGRTRGVAVLEHLDSIGLTYRVGDERFLRSEHSPLICAPADTSHLNG